MGNNSTKKSKKSVSTVLTDDQLAMLRNETGLSEERLRQWHADFLKTYPNGQISKKQFKDLFVRCFPEIEELKFGASLLSKVAFLAVDQDHDGQLDFNEWLLYFAATFINCKNSDGKNQSLDTRLQVIFELYDHSNDHFIDQQELTEMIKDAYDLNKVTDRTGANDPKKRAEDIMQQLDKSGDRKLSKAEFVKGVQNDPILQSVLLHGSPKP